jgi:hypothetical protein
LRGDGDETGARAVLTAMENDRLRYGKVNPLIRVFLWLSWATIGYGYHIWWAVLWICSLVLLGFLLFGWGIRRGWIRATEDHTETYKPVSPLIYSLETFLPLVDLHQAKHWFPDARASGGKNLRRYLWFHILAGWFFASMLIAGVTGLVQK